jgi:hypothetical protein
MTTTNNLSNFQKSLNVNFANLQGGFIIFGKDFLAKFSRNFPDFQSKPFLGSMMLIVS